MSDKLDIDLMQGLKENGLTFKGLSEGKVVAEDNNGQQFDINVNDFLKSHGISPEQVGSITYNDTKSALNEAPQSLSTLDRAKLSVGNDKGKLKYLKDKFEDAAIDEENGIVVKENGAWKKLDPSGVSQYFRDPWELSRDIADLSDIGINAAATAYGAAKGTAAGAVGGPVASAITGVIGAAQGGAVAGGLRTSLGRLVGTYDSTPEEQLKDIGLETLLSAGGQGVALGAKPVLGQLVKASKWIVNKGGDAAVDGIASVLGTTTNTGAGTMKTVIENAPAYSSRMKSFASKAASSEDIINMAANSQIKNTDTLLDTAAKELPKKYGQLLDQLGNKADGLSVNMKDVLSISAQNLEEQGFGKIIQQGKRYSFQPFTSDEIAARTLQGLPVESLDKTATKEINEIINRISPFSQINTKGKSAVKALTTVNKTINEVSNDLYKSNASPTTLRAVSKISEGFKNGVSKQFENAGLAKDYGNLQGIYTQYGNAVSSARSILRSEKGSETLANQLVSAAGKNMTAKGNVAQLVELAGPLGEKAYKDIVLDDAVKKTASWAPKWGLLNIGLAGAGLASGGMAAVLSPVAIPAATAFSPRIAATTLSKVGSGTSAIKNGAVQYGMKALDFFKGRTPQQLEQIVKNPQLFQAIFREAVVNLGQEEANTMKLLQDNGAIPNGQR